MSDHIYEKLLELNDFLDRAEDLGFETYNIPIEALELFVNIASAAYHYGRKNEHIWERLERLDELDFGTGYEPRDAS